MVLGAATGAIYTVSPLTLIFAFGMIPICRWGVRGLGDRERRWVMAALVTAIVARMLAIAALLLATDPMREQFGSFFPDARFATSRSWWILNVWQNVPVGPHQVDGVYNPYGASSFHSLLALIQLIVGRAPYAINLVSVACAIGGSLLLFRLARRAYGTAVAGAGLLVLLFWPTLFAWSLSTLREAAQLFLMAVVLVATVDVVRARKWTSRVRALAIAALGIYAFATLGAEGYLMVAPGLALGLFIRVATLRWRVAVVALLAVVAAGVVLSGQAAVRDRVVQQVQLAAYRHIGHVESQGGSFKLLDDRFYVEGPNSVLTLSAAESMRYLLRSVAAFMVVPLPWQIASRPGLLALPEQCAWYLLIVFALVGIGTAVRRDALVTALLAAFVVVGMLVVAPTSGNIGTLVRQRDLVVPAVVWLAGAALYPIARVWS